MNRTETTMPRRATHTKTPELLAAEKAAADLLQAFNRAARGNAAMLARTTGIKPSDISKLAAQKSPRAFSMEQAILLDLATDGALKAEKLCPAQAAQIRAFRKSK